MRGLAIVFACFAVSCSTPAATEDAADGTVVTPYLAMGDALARDRAEGISTLAALVLQAAEREAGKTGIDLLRDGAQRIEGEDLGMARAAYERMSTGMIAHLQADPAQQKGRMIVHCSMAFSGRGAAWVQAEGKVMNPYEGSRMLHCGDKIPWGQVVPQ